MQEKLMDVVNDLEDGVCISVGCRDGSGFFFIGTKSDFDAYADDISYELLETKKKELHNFLVNKEKLMYAIKELKAFDAENLNKITLSKLCKVASYTNSFAKKAIIGEVRIPILLGEINRFVDIRQRVVVADYDCISSDGFVVIVEGNDDGKCWFRKEFESLHPTFNLQKID